MSSTAQRLPKPLPWPFPAKSTHDGLPLGNGLFGALLWGEGGVLCITINRQDYWDHRGGIAFGGEARYANLKLWLESGDETSVQRVFEGRGTESPGQPRRPTRLPMGRVDIELGPELHCVEGSLDVGAGCAVLALGGRAPSSVEAVVPRGRPLLAVRLAGLAGPLPAAQSPGGHPLTCKEKAGHVSVHSVPPDADEVRRYYDTYGFPAAEVHDELNSGGWVQKLPADPALCVAWELHQLADGACTLFITAEYGVSPDEAREQGQRQLQWAVGQGYRALADQEASWWRGYWQQTASVELPDVGLQEMYVLGMYKLPGISWPGTPAATLQGPWVEEYRMPPWSSDYHFNINVQECYWPAYAGNQLASLEPLFGMLRSWEPRLRENARQFLGIEDGLMLSHAVDDRCTGMGGFWTGTIDHGSTAWSAQLMWQYYLHTLDRGFLAETAYPFMAGAMRAYEAMLEEGRDGRYALPVSVSPEYNGAAFTAWGRDASFQLALVHFLCRALVRAARILGVDNDAVGRWQRIDEGLPLGSVAGEGTSRELQLWDGQPLAHSHRHHSHLAGLYPFDVFDPWGNADDMLLMCNSLRTWTDMGTGEWTGWCMPWAAILNARMHRGERAALLLEEQRRAFMTAGRATTHDAVFPGLTIFDKRPDVMQIEAAMGSAAAILEMLVHTAHGTLYVFPAVPAQWTEVRFGGGAHGGSFPRFRRADGGQDDLGAHPEHCRQRASPGAALRSLWLAGAEQQSAERDVLRRESGHSTGYACRGRAARCARQGATL